MFLNTKFVSAANVERAGKRENICVNNNVSATMCPRLPGPLPSPSYKTLFPYDAGFSYLLSKASGQLCRNHAH